MALLLRTLSGGEAQLRFERHEAVILGGNADGLAALKRSDGRVSVDLAEAIRSCREKAWGGASDA